MPKAGMLARAVMRATMLMIAAALTCGGAFGQVRPGTGFEPTPPAVFAQFPHMRVRAMGAGDRPASLTLEEFLPPIASQGPTGSCVGWSTAYYCYSTTVAEQRKLTPEERQDPRFLFSPAFVWHQFNKGQAGHGMYIYEAFDVLAKQGCATMDVCPWDGSDVTSQPTDAARAKAARYVARQTVLLFRGALQNDPPDPEKLKTWLAETHRPFVMGISIFEDIYNVPHAPNYVYEPGAASGRPWGRHAITIIGYDDVKQAFLMVNSWGPAWGNNGKLWLSENYVRTAREGWGQRPGGPIARDARGGLVRLTPHIEMEPPIAPRQAKQSGDMKAQ